MVKSKYRTPGDQIELRSKERERLLKTLTATKDDEDVVQKSMGIFGKWHFWVCMAIFLVKFPVGWHQLSIVIQAPAVDFECSDNSTPKCDEACPSHRFDKSVFTETIISQWDLVCGRAVLANMAQTTTMLGILVGNVLFGYWSDKCGRRNPMVYAVLIQVVAGTLAAVVPWFWAFLGLRFMLAIATGGTMCTSFVLIMELVGTKWRTTLATLYQLPFNLSHLSLALIGYLIRDWRYSQLVISLPSILLISYFWILPESPRWLIAVGQEDKAIKILEKAAFHNKLPTETIEEEIKSYVQKKTDAPKSGGNIFDLFRTRNLRIKTFCICTNWIICGLCFFGVAQYIGQLGGNMFFNIATSAAIQIPGTLISILALEKLGRKYTLILSNFIAGVPMLIIPLIPQDHWGIPFIAVVAMFGLSICFPTIYIYTGELFPTVIRNVGVGTASMCARFGSVVAPHISTLGTFAASWVPQLIFGSFPILAAVLCYWLPETLHCKLPETVEDAENFGMEIKVVENGTIEK